MIDQRLRRASFGTSNSTVSVIEKSRARPGTLEGEHVTLPSAVFFNFEDNHTYLGRKAIADTPTAPKVG